MGMTATLSLSPSTQVTEGVVTGTLTVSNSSNSVVNLTSVVPYAYPSSGSVATINSGVAIGPVNLGPNSPNISVPASSSLILSFPVTFHGPPCGSLNGTVTGGTTFQQVYKVGATCYSNDGSVFVPSEQSVTINYAVTFGSAEN